MIKSDVRIQEMAQEPEKWMDYVRLRCKECLHCGENWHWSLSCNRSGVPTLNSLGVNVSVRKVVYRIHKGVMPLKNRVVTTNCKNLQCVNPDLLVQFTKQQVVNRTAKRGGFSSPSIRMKVAEYKRSVSKLSQESVREIVASSDHPKALAEQYGISEAYVYMIRKGQFRREIVNNPFSGLLR